MRRSVPGWERVIFNWMKSSGGLSGPGLSLESKIPKALLGVFMIIIKKFRIHFSVFSLLCMMGIGRLAAETDTGYRGIWFDIGQPGPYGSKYSGGLGTYTEKHVPLAVYAPAVNKTFFVWGGTEPGAQKLRLMISYYNHTTGKVPLPVIVHHKDSVNDPHDDPALSIDSAGFLWVWIAGRANIRPGFVYKSTKPYDINNWELIKEQKDYAYPHVWYNKGKGFLVQFTDYNSKGERELFMETSPDGITWNPRKKLVGFGGHYPINWMRDGKLIMAFDYHPGGVDTRTNLYYMETEDMGTTWKNINGDVLTMPLDNRDNPALVRDYEKENRMVYVKDIAFTKASRPVILYLTSDSSIAGPLPHPRELMTARWTGTAWDYRKLTETDHNYDMGSMYIEEDASWNVIAPTGVGPQAWGTGGEMQYWHSENLGVTWTKIADLTENSTRNHSYARRVLNGDPGFYAFWADGNANEFSESRLYFCDKAGNVYELPPEMTGTSATPRQIRVAPTSLSETGRLPTQGVKFGSPEVRNPRLFHWWRGIFRDGLGRQP